MFTIILTLLINAYLMINNIISQYLSVSNLGAVVSLFVGVLLPVAILLLETVNDNVIDRAVILREVINLEKVLTGLGLIAFSFLLWEIKPIRPVDFVLFIIGFTKLIQVLLRAVFWVSDWSESFPDGVRYKWRKQILSDKAMSGEKRLKLWGAYLDSFTKIDSDRMTLAVGFSTGEQFLDFFKSYYNDAKVDKFELLTSTSHYISAIFSSPRSHEDEFLKFGFGQLMKLQDSKDHPEVILAWESLVRQDCHLIAHDDLRTHILLNVIEEFTPKQVTKEKSLFYRKLAQLICDLIWERNRSVQDDDLLTKSAWRISSDHISLDKGHGAAPLFLLNAFWQKVDQIKTRGAAINDLSNLGMRIDSLVRVIFSEADPMVLGQLYEIFRIRPIPPFESDWSKLVCDMLNGHPVFGYTPRGSAVWSVQKEDSNEDEEAANAFFAEQLRRQERESIEIVMKSSPLFSDPVLANKYCEKILGTLNSTSFSDLVKRDSLPISRGKVKASKNLITKVKARLDKAKPAKAQ